MKATVYSVERCYDYEGCSLERVFGTKAEADAYVDEQKNGGTFAELCIGEWEVDLPCMGKEQESK